MGSSLVELSNQGFRGTLIAFAVPLACFPRFELCVGVVLKHRVVHRRRSFAGPGTRGSS